MDEEIIIDCNTEHALYAHEQSEQTLSLEDAHVYTLNFSPTKQLKEKHGHTKSTLVRQGRGFWPLAEVVYQGHHVFVAVRCSRQRSNQIYTNLQLGIPWSTKC